MRSGILMILIRPLCGASVQRRHKIPIAPRLFPGALRWIFLIDTGPGYQLNSRLRLYLNAFNRTACSYYISNPQRAAA